MLGLLVPAQFDYIERGLIASSAAGRLDEELSLGVAVVLILVYIANLIYTLVTHRDVFEFRRSDEETHQTPWPTSSFFLGVVVLAIIGNAAEYVAAIISPARIGWAWS